jgi:conjugal transfer pilus assembly protein TraV
MKETFKIFMVGIVIAVALCGCSVVNPYHENFVCRAPDDKGHCVGMGDAYGNAIGEIDLDAPEVNGKKCKTCAKDNIAQHIDFATLAKGSKKDNNQEAYQNAVYSRLIGLLENPETPMVDPPRIMRVLILPYKDDGDVLYMPRYTYLKVEESRWVIGDYLVNDKGE